MLIVVDSGLIVKIVSGYCLVVLLVVFDDLVHVQVHVQSLFIITRLLSLT